MNSDRTIMNGWVSRIVICLVVLLVTHPRFILAQSPEPPLQSANESLSSDRMLADIRTLSGPSFNGRQSGTKDDLDSARWVAQEFLSAGLHLPRIRNGSLIIPLLTERDGAAPGAMATLVPTATMPSDSVLKSVRQTD
jgi:hypothetical protein